PRPSPARAAPRCDSAPPSCRPVDRSLPSSVSPQGRRRYRRAARGSGHAAASFLLCWHTTTALVARRRRAERAVRPSQSSEERRRRIWENGGIRGRNIVWQDGCRGTSWSGLAAPYPRGDLLRADEAVAGAALGLDVARAARSLQFGAQPADEDLQ